MFASSACKLPRPRIKVRRDSDRASISPSYLIRQKAEADLQITGGGGVHSDSEITGGPGLIKNFSALGASFWSKNKRVGPLPYIRHRRLCSPTFGIIFWCSIFNFANRCRWIIASDGAPAVRALAGLCFENSSVVYNMSKRHSRNDNAFFLGPFWSKTKGAPGSPAPLP